MNKAMKTADRTLIATFLAKVGVVEVVLLMNHNARVKMARWSDRRFKINS
jgi:hypothetical protein